MEKNALIPSIHEEYIPKALLLAMLGTGVAGGTTALVREIARRASLRKKKGPQKNVYLQPSADVKSAAKVPIWKSPYTMPAAAIGAPLSFLLGYKGIDKLLDMYRKKRVETELAKAKRLFEEAVQGQFGEEQIGSARREFEPIFDRHQGKVAEHIKLLDEAAEEYEKSAQPKPTQKPSWLNKQLMGPGYTAGLVTGPLATWAGMMALMSWYLTHKGMSRFDPERLHEQAVKYRAAQARRKLPSIYGLPAGTPSSVKDILENKPESLTNEKLRELLETA